MAVKDDKKSWREAVEKKLQEVEGKLEDPKKERQSLHKKIIDSYFQFLMTTMQVAQGTLPMSKQMREPATETERTENAILWGLMRDAHIFEFPTQAYPLFYHIADRHTTEEIFGEPWTPALAKDLFKNPPVIPTQPMNEDQANAIVPAIKDANDALSKTKIYVEKLDEFARDRVGIDADHMPFPVVYLAWGEGPVMPEMNQILLEKRLGKDGFTDKIRTQAFVLSEKWCFELLIEELEQNHPNRILHGITTGTSFICHRMNGEWMNGHTLAPFVAAQAINFINNNDAFILDGPPRENDRWRAAQIRKKFKNPCVPPPYYSVLLREALEEEQKHSSRVSKVVEHQYRWDVRGNWANRVVDGILPIDPKVEKKLRQRKFKIVTSAEQLTVEEMAMLSRKRIRPPRLGEWMAIRRWWRKDHEKGPGDAPKIPSTRRVSRSRIPVTAL